MYFGLFVFSCKRNSSYLLYRHQLLPAHNPRRKRGIEVSVLTWGWLSCSLLIEVRVLCYQSWCQDCFHFMVVFKIWPPRFDESSATTYPDSRRWFFSYEIVRHWNLFYDPGCYVVTWVRTLWRNHVLLPPKHSTILPNYMNKQPRMILILSRKPNIFRRIIFL
jgi:hypothetical protein